LQQQQQQLIQNQTFTGHNIKNNYFTNKDLLAGAQLQASSYNQNQAKILTSQQQQPFVYQPPNTFAPNAQVASIGVDQVIQQQQQPHPQIPQDPYNSLGHQAGQQFSLQPNLLDTSNYQQPSHILDNQTSGQHQQHFAQQQIPYNNNLQNLQHQAGNKHFLPHQRSLPLPPPILQQLQARQQQQQLQRQYYQAANRLLFDDQRYYAGSNPLIDQSSALNSNNIYHFNDSSLYNQQQQQQQGAASRAQLIRPYQHQFGPHYSRSRRAGFNLESTRGLNQSLQSQWLYGGVGRRSMAGDLLSSGQASALGDVFDADQKIVRDFCLLYDESRQLFNGLR